MTQQHYEDAKHNKIRKAAQEAKERKQQAILEKQLEEIDESKAADTSESGDENKTELKKMPLPAMEALLQQYRDNILFTNNALKEYTERKDKLEKLEEKLSAEFAQACMENPDYIPGMIKTENNPMVPLKREEIASVQVTAGEIGEHDEVVEESAATLPEIRSAHPGQHDGANALKM